MCNGSFFTEWPYCLQCLYVHGLRSQRDTAFYNSVIASASGQLCGQPTPTADFQNIFSKIQATLAQPTTGSTVSSDQFPSQTAVSLYYTASGPIGPGAITGSATAATATGGASNPGSKSSASNASGGSNGSGVSVNTATATRASSSSSSSTGSATASASSNAAVGYLANKRDSLLTGTIGTFLVWWL
jgi:hypothetical protein